VLVIDIIVWEDAKSDTVYASAVSVDGCRAIGKILDIVPKDGLCGWIPLNVCPNEFLSHIPKKLQVYFYRRTEGTMLNVRELASKQLQ
jgi:hypothetical protein